MGIFGKFLKKENKTEEPQRPEHIVHTYKDFLKFLVGFNDGKIDG